MIEFSKVESVLHLAGKHIYLIRMLELSLSLNSISFLNKTFLSYILKKKQPTRLLVTA